MLCIVSVLGMRAQEEQTIVNGDMSDQWTTHTRVGASDDNWGQATSNGVNCYETWRGHGTTEYEMSQEVTLPAGKYVFQAYAFYRKGAAWDTEPTASEAVIFAGATEKTVWSLGGIPLASYPSNQAGAANQFANGYYMNTVEFTLASEQTISIGCKGTHTAGNSWFVMGPAALYKVDNAGITGNYYLKNSGNGEYFCSGNYWGTHAITNAFGYAVKIAAMANGYSVDTHVTNGGASHFWAGEYTDGEATALVFESTGTDNEYYIKTPEGKYLTAGTSGADVTLADASSDNAKWQLETLAAHETAAATALATKVATLDAATNASPVDATFYIPYATLMRNNQHMYSYWSDVPSVVGNNPHFAYEYFNKNFDIHQTVTGLKTGKYALTVNAYYRAGGNDTSDGDTKNAILYANGVEVAVPNALPSVHSNNAGTGSDLLSNGTIVSEPVYVYITDGTLTLGLKKETLIANDWTLFNYFNLKYHGNDVVTTEYANALIATIPSNESVTTAVASNLESLKTTLSSTLAKSDYDALEAAINDANTNIVPTYAKFLTAKTNVLALKDQTTKFTDAGGTATSALTSAASTQQTAVDAATTKEAIETAIVALRRAAGTFAGAVTINSGQYLDMTDAMLFNAAMRETGGLSLWNIVSNTNAAYPKYNGRCSEFWNANFEFNQTAYELPAGNYNIEVSAFHRAGTYNTYLYAKDGDTMLGSVQVLPISNGENSMTDAANSFDEGKYVNSLVLVLDATKDVKIGFKNEDTETDKWTIFRDFKIKFFGSDALALYRDQYEEALDAAAEAIESATYTNVGGTDRSNLSTAVTTTYPKSVVETGETQEKFETATSALTSLTTTFKNGVASWNSYAAAINTAKTEADYISTSIYTGLSLTEPTTAAEASSMATANAQTIRVAIANYVGTNYTYSLTGKIGDFSTWTATAKYNTGGGDINDTPQTNNDQHWSTTTRDYYEQGKNGWNATNGFNCTYTKTANLPAGNYVLKVAARASGAVTGTLSATATANTIALPNVGSATKGIDTSGAANYGEGTFANGGAGFGWEWRFLPFTVASAGEVTITINESTTARYNWFSLADAELLSDADKSTPVTLSDASDMATTISANDGELATVTLQRSIKVGYNTVCLPFGLTAVQVQALFGAESVVYTYSETSADANSVDLTFSTLSAGNIIANTPVLVKATVASTENVIAGVIIAAPAATPAVEGTNFDYVGVYANTTFAEGDYFLGTKEGTQYVFQSNGTDSAKPFRAYFQKKTTGNVRANLFIDGVATAIEAIEAQPAEQNGAIFNLAGQRVNKAQKGLYIINGKKVVIK